MPGSVAVSQLNNGFDDGGGGLFPAFAPYMRSSVRTSWTMSVAGTLCDSDPLVPVTVR